KRFYFEPSPFGPMAGILSATREPYIDNNVTLESIQRAGGAVSKGTEAPKSVVFVPLIVGEIVQGYVSLQNIDRHGAFSDSDVRLLQTLANSMSVALENARLFDETQRLLKETEQRNAELAIINSVQEALAAKLNMQAIYNAVGDKVRDIFDAQVLLISIFDEKQGTSYVPYTVEKGQRFNFGSDPGPLTALERYVIRTRQMFLCNERFVERAQELFGEMNIPAGEVPKSLVAMPLIARDQVKGMISLQNVDREQAFSNSDVRLLGTLANSMSVALENARLFDEISRHARESAALNEVGRDISSTLDLSSVMERIASHARELLNVDTSAIFLPEADGEAYKAIVVLGANAEQIKVDTIATGEGIIGSLAQQGKAEFINDTSSDPRARQIPGTRDEAEERLMVAPLLAGDKVSGMMAVWRTSGAPFGQLDLEFLPELSLQAAIAIKNANLFDDAQLLLKETEQRNAELAIITSVQQGLASKLEMQAIYDLVGDKIQKIFDAQSVLIANFDYASGLTHIPYNIELGQRFYSNPYPFTGLHKELIQTGQTILINEDAEQKAKEMGMVLVPGTQLSKSMLFVPLISGSSVNGVISLQNIEREHAFSESDVRLLETLASSMSVALENARLFDETQRLFKAEQERVAELAVINTVQEGLAKHIDLNGIVDLIGEKVGEIFSADTVDIWMYDAVRDWNYYVYYSDRGQRINFPPGPAPRPSLGITILDSRKPLLLGTQEEQSALGVVLISKEEGQEDQNQSYLGVPILAGQNILGLISIQSYQEKAFHESHLRLLTTLANSMSVALENARLFDETQRLLKETEQRNAELAIINSVQEALAAQLDIHGVFNVVGDKLRDIFNYQDVTIYYGNSGTRTVTVEYSFVEGQKLEPKNVPINSMYEYFLSSNETFVFNGDLPSFAAQFSDYRNPEPPKSLLAVPVRRNKDTDPVIYLTLQDWEGKKIFTESDVRLLQTLANSMSVALENARLFDE
ncbi:MAG: GAF domain-containing protein, partial [Byssovorax cruenta]